MGDVTQVLAGLAAGLPGTTEALAELVYAELRQIARRKLAAEPEGHTLQPTALVHEVWLRLFGGAPPAFASRPQFFAAAAEGMRRILIERARRKKSLKRGSGAVPVNLEDVDVAARADDDTLLLVAEALERLQTEHPEAARFIELRFFTGLSNAEAAQALGLPERTARRHWTFARAWLYREIRALEAEAAPPAGPSGPPANRGASPTGSGELLAAQ
jgi:RNA polymerase sigma factor (TIGR02999 family)